MNSHLHKRYWLTGLVIILIFSIQSSGQPFTLDQNVSDSLANIYDGEVLWGDYDSDGDLDILIAGNTLNEPVLEIYKNELTGFQALALSLPGLQNSNVSWCDFDNDNDLDFLLIGTKVSEKKDLPLAVLYHNIGNDMFEEFDANILGVYEGESAWGDLDNDGDQDLLIIGNKGEIGITRIYQNIAGVEFELMDHDLINIYNGDITLGDYDNDMDLDILMIGTVVNTTGGEDKVLKLYRNEGDFSFMGVFAEFIGMSESCVQWADYDSDGDLDILANGSTEAPTHLVYLYQNLNNDSFMNIGIEIFGTVNGSAVWGDYDVDGDLDFLLTGMPSYGSDPITEIYRNINLNLFNKDDNVDLLEIFHSSTKWGDYDNDGDLDILMSGLTSQNADFETFVYNNENVTSNTVPTSPTNLQAFVNDNSVILSWSKSSDNETVDDGLTYNIRVGTSSGASDIVSPLSLEDGSLLIPALGNVNQNKNWEIGNLSPDIYYWSVQAVDNNFDGSTFANENSFEILVSGITKDQLIVNSNLPLINLYPNPFTDKITFDILTNEKLIVSAYIMDISGVVVRTIVDNRQIENSLVLEWNGTNNLGNELAEGLYYFVLQTDNHLQTKKVMLIY